MNQQRKKIQIKREEGGRTGEVAAYCGRKTQSVVQQLQLFSPASSYDKRSVTARKKLAIIVLDKGRWQRSDIISKNQPIDWSASLSFVAE